MIIIITLLMCFDLKTKAQGDLPGGFKHIIEVGQYPDYGKGYLTITDDNGVGIEKNGVSIWNFYTYEYVDEYKDNIDARLYQGELILEVDGVSAAGWTKEQFYNKVDNRHDVITLKIRGKSKEKGIYDYTTKIRPLYELPDSVKVFGNIFATISGQTTAERRKVNLTKDTSFEERIDEDFDFFSCMYYDYLLNSSDPILDKELLKKIHIGMERNDSAPDLLLTIARDANESINTTYIPPSSRVVNEGSVTHTQYNYLTKRNDYITRQNNRVIHEGGYTQETKTADIFLEIADLDAKRINDPNINYPPVVWKATAKRHVLNPSFSLNTELEAFASRMTLPLTDRSVWAEQKIYAPVGISWGEDHFVLQNVVAGSRAERIGLMPGDIIVKAEVPSKYLQKIVKKNFKKQGWGALYCYPYETYSIVVLRDGNKMNLTLQPASILAFRYYLVGAK